MKRKKVESSEHGLPWERLGEVAAQLAACATECESFLAEQLEALERLAGQLPSRNAGAAYQRHPHEDDPVVASVLAELTALRATFDGSDAALDPKAAAV